MRNPVLLIAMLAVGLAPVWAGDEPPPATQPTRELFDAVARTIGTEGGLADGVYTVTLPRKDLAVFLEDGPVPAAVLKSEFQFFKCDCGKMEVIGQFCVADYESNDVIDALRGGAIKVASVAPMLMGEHPRVLIVRFQAAGETPQLAKTLKSALEWTGEARMAPATRPIK